MRRLKKYLFVGVALFSISSCATPNITPKSIDIFLEGKIAKKLDAVVGDTYQLTAQVNPYQAEQVVTWTSNDSDVASISPAGELSIEGVGEAIITAKSTFNNNIKCNFYVFADAPVGQTGVGDGTTKENPIFIGNEDHDAPLEIYFIEVRQMYADAIYIKKGMFDMLIDAGEDYDGKYVSEFLKTKMEDNRLDILMASHGDSDHIAGMQSALKDIAEISTIIDYGGTQGGSYYQAKQKYINKENGAKYHTAYDCVNYQKGASDIYYLCDDFTLEILDTGAYTKNDDKGGSNPNSVACLFTYKDFKFFTAGDLTRASEESLLRREDLPEVTLYKASHHGSHGSNSNELMNTLNPKGVAISAARATGTYGDVPSGVPNKNDKNLGLVTGHPADEAVERIYQIPNIRQTLDVRRNAVNGTLCYKTYGTDSFEFTGAGPLKGYYDISKTGGVGVWDEAIKDFKNKVTGEANKKFHETVAFKNRGYQSFVEELI